jgi:hypothetical protein
LDRENNNYNNSNRPYSSPSSSRLTATTTRSSEIIPSPVLTPIPITTTSTTTTSATSSSKPLYEKKYLLQLSSPSNSSQITTTAPLNYHNTSISTPVYDYNNGSGGGDALESMTNTLEKSAFTRSNSSSIRSLRNTTLPIASSYANTAPLSTVTTTPYTRPSSSTRTYSFLPQNQYDMINGRRPWRY